MCVPKTKRSQVVSPVRKIAPREARHANSRAAALFKAFGHDSVLKAFGKRQCLVRDIPLQLLNGVLEVLAVDCWVLTDV